MAQVRCAVIALTLNRASKKAMRGRIALKGTECEIEEDAYLFRVDRTGRSKFNDPNDRRVIFASPLVDVAANMDLVRETIEGCKLILELKQPAFTQRRTYCTA